MLWYIVKRELFEQVNSLRFALAMLLTVFFNACQRCRSH